MGKKKPHPLSTIYLVNFSQFHHTEKAPTQRAHPNPPKRGTHRRRNRHRRERAGGDAVTTRHSRRPLESLRSSSAPLPGVANHPPRVLHPMRHRKPRRNTLQTLPSQRHYPRFLRVVDRVRRRGTQHAHVPEHSRFCNPERPQFKAYRPPNGD